MMRNLILLLSVLVLTASVALAEAYNFISADTAVQNRTSLETESPFSGHLQLSKSIFQDEVLI